MSNPDSVEGWLTLARQHEGAAKLLVQDKRVASQGYFHAGLAVECALKAYIMRRERLNAWPSKEAGADYLKAVRALGLDPDALLWAYDTVIKKHVLVLVTDMFDFRGPYEVSQLLFQAYNNAGTPREIDPFIVRLHSPKHTIVPELL